LFSGVYPYEYTDTWEKLDETEIPPRHEFFSKLTGENISDKAYEHVQEVWKHFKCKTLGNVYIYIYLLKIKHYLIFFLLSQL